MINSLDKNLEYLYSLDGRGIRLGLARIKLFVEYLNNPQAKLKIIHVAGTNGKGSTCAMLFSILQALGFRVGLFTSPHLLKFNERIRINNKFISDKEIIDFIKKNRPFIDKNHTTFFETTTAMALNHFANQKVDYAIMEVGLGGRFDATNIVTPVVSIITSLGKDHEKRLGKTIKEIAGEKAGIAKPGIPCVVAKQRPTIKQHLINIISDKKSTFIYAPDICTITRKTQSVYGQNIDINYNNITLENAILPLLGKHQLINLQTAIGAMDQICDIVANKKALQTGINKILWPGRMQILQKQPLVIYDVGHNAHGIRQVVNSLTNLLPEIQIDVLLGLKGNKKHDMLGDSLKKLNGEIFITEVPDTSSSSPDQVFRSLLKKIDRKKLHIISKPEQILMKYKTELTQNECLLILGSHYIAPTINKYFCVFT